MTVVNPGRKDMHDKMDAHVKREEKVTRRTNDRRVGGKFAKSQHRAVTAGARVKRGETVVYPYGGTPYRTYEGAFASKQNWKRSIENNRDKIGKQVATESSRARPGCALVTVTPDEATAFAYKLRAALKGKQVRDTVKAHPALKTGEPAEPNPLAYKHRTAPKGNPNQPKEWTRATDPTVTSARHVSRTTRVLAELEYAAQARETITLGVFTRAELQIIGAQRTPAKHITRHVRNLERKLAGNR